MNRRTFIGSSFAGLAAAQVRSFAANDHVNLAMIGVGGRGRSLLGGLLESPGVKVTHICDVDTASIERAQAVVKKASAAPPAVVRDMRELLQNREVDAVVIATPDHWHGPATILACNSGKDVYVEKPAAHNIRESRLMIEAARHNGRIVQVGTQSRTRPSTVRAIEFIRSGKIGEVLCAKAWDIQKRDDIGHKPDGPVPEGVDYNGWLGPAPWIPFNENRFHYKWHWHWHFGTGDAGNDGAHQIDIARWALGESYPDRASGTGRKLFFKDDQQTPDTMNVTFDYKGKSLIWEMRIWTSYPMEGIDNGVAVYGTEGMVHIGRWNRVWGYKVFDGAGKEILFDKETAPSEGHMENFVASMRSRKLPNADIGEGHLSAIHCHLANIVSRVGRTVSFDAENEMVKNDTEANLYVRRQYRAHWATPVGA
ncbi:MAG: Gfo/Idh/MocA family oxidoreductase [Bryobacterales bacterium]|nr:Gfo/Idh/MocA family oxidoreductase [Bryobacterales bacterium]